MTRMTVLDELAAITNTQIPDKPGGEFWEVLVRTGAALGDSDWSQLSKDAKSWLNIGVYALKGREGYEIVPLELPEPDSPPAPDPVVEEAAAAAEKPADIEPPPRPPPVERGRIGRPPKAEGEPSKRRARSFKRGRCYCFAMYLVQRDGGLGGKGAPELAQEYNAGQKNEKLQVSDRTASVLLYDILATLRVLRDLDLFDHVIVEEIPKQDIVQGGSAP